MASLLYCVFINIWKTIYWTNVWLKAFTLWPMFSNCFFISLTSLHPALHLYRGRHWDAFLNLAWVWSREIARRWMIREGEKREIGGFIPCFPLSSYSVATVVFIQLQLNWSLFPRQSSHWVLTSTLTPVPAELEEITPSYFSFQMLCHALLVSFCCTHLCK